jgi:hypothetical protein
MLLRAQPNRSNLGSQNSGGLPVNPSANDPGLQREQEDEELAPNRRAQHSRITAINFSSGVYIFLAKPFYIKSGIHFGVCRFEF